MLQCPRWNNLTFCNRTFQKLAANNWHAERIFHVQRQQRPAWHYESDLLPTFSSIGEGMELRLAHLPARLAKQDAVVGVRVEWWIEINEVDARVRKFFPIRKPFEIVAEIKAVHLNQHPEI